MSQATTASTPEPIFAYSIPLGEESDPFWSAANQARLKESVDQLNAGHGHAHELIEAWEQKQAGDRAFCNALTNQSFANAWFPGDEDL
jgi:hypothetical protein